MNRPVILSLIAIACALPVFAVPAYHNIQQDSVVQGKAATSDTVSGKHWQCVMQTGPVAAGKMQITHAINNPESTVAEDTLYSCSMLASRP